jgi:hypothetical protein
MKLTCPLVCFAALFAAQGALAQLRNDALAQSPADPKEFIIPDSGWRLWPDTQASWQNDTLYLPDQVNLSQLPVNAPTGGWDMLTSSNGISVKLPASVEQYYWGQLSLRPYNNSAGTSTIMHPMIRRLKMEPIRAFHGFGALSTCRARSTPLRSPCAFVRSGNEWRCM